MWWMYIVVVAVLAFGIYSFGSLVSFRTRVMNSKTTRRAEDMYGLYADPPPKRHRRSLEGITNRLAAGLGIWPWQGSPPAWQHEIGVCGEAIAALAALAALATEA